MKIEKYPRMLNSPVMSSCLIAAKASKYWVCVGKLIRNCGELKISDMVLVFTGSQKDGRRD